MRPLDPIAFSSSALLFLSLSLDTAAQVDSIWLFTPLDSTALHTPFSTWTLERTFPVPQSLFLSPFSRKGERSDSCLYPSLARSHCPCLFLSSWLSISIYRATGGFRFISRLSIRHLIYSIYRAPHCGWYASIITLWAAYDCGMKLINNGTWWDYISVQKGIMKW